MIFLFLDLSSLRQIVATQWTVIKQRIEARTDHHQQDETCVYNVPHRLYVATFTFVRSWGNVPFVKIGPRTVHLWLHILLSGLDKMGRTARLEYAVLLTALNHPSRNQASNLNQKSKIDRRRWRVVCGSCSTHCERHWLKSFWTKKNEMNIKSSLSRTKFSMPLSHCISITLYLFSLLVVTTHALHLMSLSSNHHHHSVTHRSFQHASPHLWNQLPTSLRIPHPNYSSPSKRPSFEHAGLTCYLLPSLFHCFTLSSKPTFSENLILHLRLFLSVGLILGL